MARAVDARRFVTLYLSARRSVAMLDAAAEVRRTFAVSAQASAARRSAR